jgi:hypothetical protein
MASKYAPLQRQLERTPGQRLRLTFAEIEATLGFKLPRSAQVYPQWWANVGGSHVQAGAWMGAGWRTCEVDVPGGRVTFERDAPAAEWATPGVEEPGKPFVRLPERVDLQRLTPRALLILADYIADANNDLEAALSCALEDADLTRRRRLVEWFRANSPRVPGDSTDLIREDRDAR